MNHLFEITFLKNFNGKKSSKLISEIFDIIHHYDLFSCGIQKKGQKIRVLCQSEVWNEIIDDLIHNIDKTELKKIGYEVLN